MIEQGGVRVDGSVVSDKGLKLAGRHFVVQVGKRKFARVTLVVDARLTSHPAAIRLMMQLSSYLKLSVAVAVTTIALKTGAWWISGSVSLLSDALESLVNLAGALFALAMVVIAERPPDDDHPYGHHKAEYFSSGFEGVLIFVAALAIVWAAVQRMLAPQPLESVGWGITLSVVSSASTARWPGRC
jgi:divalent metal cation (Fe/Co/Zn/Cd) transporter